MSSSAVPAPVHRATSIPPGMGGMATPATGSLRLAAEHFTAAIAYMVAGAVGLVWIAPELAAGNFLSPHVAGITHLFTLGWLTTTILGALYQLLPVALGAPIRWPRVGHASFWTFAPGAGLFACGVADGRVVLHHAGIALIAIGITLAAVNIVSSLRRARTRDVTWAGIAIGITFLISTFALGLLLLHNLHTGFIAEARVRVLATHLHVAIVGWALMMLIGVSHRLLPMFLLAHGADTRWTKRALTLLASGVLTLALGLNTQVSAITWVAVALLEAGIFSFVRQAWEFRKARVRKRLDAGMHFASTGVGFFIAAALIGPAVVVAGTRMPRLATVYVLTALLGGLLLYVTGFMYKIIPLLSWTARFGNRMGKGKVPTVADLYSARLAHVQLGLTAGGVAIVALSILTGQVAGAYAGATLLLIGVLLFASQMARVAFGGRPTRDET